LMARQWVRMILRPGLVPGFLCFQRMIFDPLHSCPSKEGRFFCAHFKKYCPKSIDIWDKRGYNLDKKRKTGGAKNEKKFDEKSPRNS
jgi:hypothetical protein